MSQPDRQHIDTTVCVFVWNEVVTLENVIREIEGALDTSGRPYEIVVIDDGSTDGSEGVADRMAAERPHVRVVHHPQNRGLGGVYRTGFDEARGTFLSFFPGDGQFGAHLLDDLRREAEDKDLVLGYLPSRTDVVGRTLSTVERILYRALLGKMPRFQGVFMVRTDVLRRIPLGSEGRGWGIVMEMILRVARSGYRVTSIPTTLRPRVHGQSKVNNVRNIRANLDQLLALRRVLKTR